MYTRNFIPGHATKAYRRSSAVAPLILVLGTRCLVSFTPRALYSRRSTLVPIL